MRKTKNNFRLIFFSCVPCSVFLFSSCFLCVFVLLHSIVCLFLSVKHCLECPVNLYCVFLFRETCITGLRLYLLTPVQVFAHKPVLCCSPCWSYPFCCYCYSVFSYYYYYMCSWFMSPEALPKHMAYSIHGIALLQTSHGPIPPLTLYHAQLYALPQQHDTLI